MVGWDAYELFKVGEQDSNLARDAFTTFIPLSVENEARSSIIFDYFDLLSAVAAHGKTNGFGGRKLSRMASWWAFEYKDTGSGFDGGYKFWLGYVCSLLRHAKYTDTTCTVLPMPQLTCSSHT